MRRRLHVQTSRSLPGQKGPGKEACHNLVPSPHRALKPFCRPAPGEQLSNWSAHLQACIHLAFRLQNRLILWTVQGGTQEIQSTNPAQDVVLLTC